MTAKAVRKEQDLVNLQMSKNAKGGMKKIVALVRGLLASNLLYADDDCWELISSTDIRECFFEKLDLVDKKLLHVYQSKLNSIEPENKQELIKAQRLWVQFKEADCIQVANQLDDRTGNASRKFECLIRKSIDREAELEQR